MNEFLSRFSPQYLAVGLLVLVVLSIMLITIWPLWSMHASYDDRIVEINERLVQLRQRAVEDEELQPGLERLRQKHLRNGHTLKSGTEAVAAAELQKLVKQTASSNGAQVQSSQILPSRMEEGFTRVSLKVRIRGELSDVVDTFYGIESHRTFLFMDKVSIRPGARRAVRGSDFRSQFDADFELIGYMPEQDLER